MLRLHGIIGHETDAAFQARLHDLEHHGGTHNSSMPPDEAGRKRFRLATDRGTDCAVSLDRDEQLTDGALLYINSRTAIIARFGQQSVWRLRPADPAAALRLGWSAGSLHWRVRFEGDCLVVLLDGPLADYRARLEHLLNGGEVTQHAD